MKNLFSNIRFYVLSFTVFLSVLVFFQTTFTISSGSLQIIRLTQYYALLSTFYLYIVLLIGPAVFLFRFLPFRGQIMKARRSLGVSAFYFGLLHACFAFFGQLGGFQGLSFLSTKYLVAISQSFTALIILTLMAATSFDFMVEKLSFKKWKILHRFVYLAGILILIHALLLGTHFSNLSDLIPQIFSIALFFLLLLEANRFDAFLERKFGFVPRFGIALSCILVVVCLYIILGFVPATTLSGFGIHSQHIQIAKDAQKQSFDTNVNLPPSLVGDKTKRYSVSFQKPDLILANQPVNLQFKITDASNGTPINYFKTPYEKVSHLIIVDQSLSYFSHVHPDQVADGFSIATTFPKDGIYHLYIDFQPWGGIEQQFAFIVQVGTSKSEEVLNTSESSLTNIFGDFEVTANFEKPLQAAKMSVGEQQISFTIRNAKTKENITNLKPYLASFGHLVMINTKTFDYLHVHPTNLVAPKPNDVSGPTVAFLPLGLYGPIKPGMYKMFAQFNPDGQLFTSEFVVKIE